MELMITAQDVNTEVRGALDMGDSDVVSWVYEQIEKASRRLLATCPTLKTRLENDLELQGLFKDVVVEAVGRMARMDDSSVGIKSESEDGYSYQIDPLARSGNIWFPDKDLVLLGCGSADTFIPRSARLTPGSLWATGMYGRGRHR